MAGERVTRGLALAVIAGVVVGTVFWAAVGTVAPTLALHENVFVDFRINVWEPGRSLLDGESPLVGETDKGDVGGVYPPIALVATLPFALLPYGVASLLWLAALLGCVLWAMLLCGVRDPRCLALGLVSPPVIAGLAYGNVSLILVLALAGIWVWRDNHWRAGGMLGLVIAAKLFLWPLAFWMLFTRRSRGAGVTAASATLASLLGWAAVGFRGVDDFPGVTRRNAAEFLDQGLSLASVFANLGASTSLALALAAVAAAGAVGVAWRRREDDLAAFTWTVVAALLLSPIVWGHYYALLLVPIALSTPTLSRAWLLPYLTVPQLTAAPPGGAKIFDAATGVAFAILTARHCETRDERRPEARLESRTVSPATGS